MARLGKKSAFFILAGILVPLLALADAPDDQKQTRRAAVSDMDISQVKLLRWMGPGKPDTHREYLERTPQKPMAINKAMMPAAAYPPPSAGNKIVVFTNGDILDSLSDEIQAYVSKLGQLGYVIATYNGSVSTPEQLKTTIQNESENLLGCILIGSWPAAWFEVANDFDKYGHAEFPCDLFLMDLDGAWTDSDANGIYDMHTDGTGDVAPEIFIARIDASVMSGDEISLLSQYFAKDQAYWTGGFSLIKSGLTYTEDDWAASSGFLYCLDPLYGAGNYTIIAAPDTNRDDYLNRLMNPAYEYVQIACHSSPGGHSFTRGGWLSSASVLSAPPQGLAFNLFACSSLRFTYSNFLGGSYIYNAGQKALVIVGSTKTGSMLNFPPFYSSLGSNNPIGIAFRDWFQAVAPFTQSEIYWYYGMTICGDPMISLLSAGPLGVLAPNGGELWHEGDTESVTWDTNGLFDITTVDIDLSTDGGATWASLAADIPNDGSELITVPSVTSTSCLVRVRDGATGSPSDISDAVFTICQAGMSTFSVTLEPDQAVSAGAQWSVDGGAWRYSGAVVTAPLGEHTVSYRPVTGWTAPSPETVTVVSEPTSITRVYVGMPGELRITLGPANAVSAGAQWSIDGGAWQNSGAKVSALTAGTHDLTYRSIIGWTGPPAESVEIAAGETLQLDRTCYPAWLAVGEGTEGYIRALAVSGNTVYVGGPFTAAGEQALSYIAQWDGSTWLPLGSGLDGTVWALALHNGILYAGGEFTMAGDVPVNHIAKWDGANWQPLGSGTDYSVLSLAFMGDMLYAGGAFYMAGGQYAPKIARWDGSNWHAVGSGMNSSVHALAVRGSILYAGGNFTIAGGKSANYVAKWDGATWSALGDGTDYFVFALETSDDALYVGGWFTAAGGVSARRVAKWDPTGWSALGSGLKGGGTYDGVEDLEIIDGVLYAGGTFMSDDLLTEIGIAKWDGSNWSALGSGISGTVLDIEVSSNWLYAGGLFDYAGGNGANNIARWPLPTSARQEDFLGTWDGQGVYYLNSDADYAMTKMASPATMLTSGDLDDDGIDDLIGLWPSQGGIWVKKSSTGLWKLLSTTAAHIAAGDMNGDGWDDLLGTWDGQGVFYLDSASGAWIKMASPATLVTAGDIDDDGTDDLIGIWPSQGGVWVKYSSTGNWGRLASTAADIAAGDMNGDGWDDLLATWVGQGVYYRDSATGSWVRLASEATQVACGYIDDDASEDLLGIWPGQGGVWVRFSMTGGWKKLSSSARDISAGAMRLIGKAGAGAIAGIEIIPASAELADGPYFLGDMEDGSDTSPDGPCFRYREQKNLEPREDARGAAIRRVPGPGDPGFGAVQQENQIPGERKPAKQANSRKEK
jgi:hypothetical protein